MSPKKINVIKNVLDASDALAAENRAKLDTAGTICINMMSAPGSGKTTLLQKTIPAMGDSVRCAVLVGDLQTTRDADRLGGLGAEVIQINTGRGCHLSPSEIAQGLGQLEWDGLDYLFIENVGNMVCPAAFDLGEHVRAVLLSVPEGADKVAKYPTLFQGAGVVLLTKVDLVDVLGFEISQVREDLSHVNTAAPLLEVSAQSGSGMDAWLEWLSGVRRSR